MGKIIIKRLLQTIPTLLVVVTLTFCLTRMLPGDPAVAILGIEANAEDIEAMRAEMNLDKSLPEQYALYLGGLVTVTLVTPTATVRTFFHSSLPEFRTH